ncbi:MAG: hypothetical protein O9264_10400 [Leptospira sp.]|nr:hypothetical protein [Leptospira sp.]
MFGSLVKYFFHYRLWIAAYTSIVLHLSFLIYSFNNSDSIYQTMFCGPPWIYETEETGEGEISLEFGKPGENGDVFSKKGEGEEGLSDADGESGKSNGFAKSKYEGGTWDKLVQDLESTSELRKNFSNEFDNVYPNSGISDSYIKRNREYEDIIVKDVFPTLYTIRDPFKVDLEEAEDNLAVHKERNRIIEEFRKGTENSPPITMKLSTEGEKPPRTPLEMGRPSRSQYLDQTLKLKKERQLDEFISRYAGYDPNKGDLSSFVRDLYYDNLQRLAYNFSGDPSYFIIDYFQENLNKEDFLKQMMALLSQNLGTKVGTEILFTLENIYDIQARALNEYFKALALLNAATPEQKQTLRFETLRRVVEKYKPLLKQKKILNAKDLELAYTTKRLQMMDTLISNTPAGYRLNDAYFEKGRILWEAGMFRGDDALLGEAIQNWSKIKINKTAEDDFLNQKAYESILFALQDGDLRDTHGLILPIARDRIDMVLKYRLSDVLEKKKQREDKLLWPKVSKPQAGK